MGEMKVFFGEISTGHGEGFKGVIAIRECRVGVIAALVVVVFYVEAAQFRVLDTKCAARIVNILSIQRLKKKTK